jgi:hypothetical protein
VPSVEDLQRCVAELFAQHYKGIVPEEITIRDTTGRKHRFSVPPSLQPGEPKRREISPTADETEQEPKLKADHPVDIAIVKALQGSPKRLSGTQVTNKVIAENRNKPGFSEPTINRRFTVLRSRGVINSHRDDPGDDLGAGYGLVGNHDDEPQVKQEADDE